MSTINFALSTDSGSSDTDGISSDSEISVSAIDPDSAWEYSLDSGTTWVTGSSSGLFNLTANNSYAA